MQIHPSKSNDMKATAAAAAKSSELDYSKLPPLSKIPEGLREIRISVNEPATNGRSSAGPDEVVVCSSTNKTLNRKSSLMVNRTKSRLLDLNPPNQRSQQLFINNKNNIKSGEVVVDEEDEDPFLEDDLPEKYKNTMRFNALSIIQLLSLILIIAALICTLTIKPLRHKTLLQSELWKWELMVLVMISGRLLSGWAIRLAVFSVERNYLLRKRVLYFVYGLRSAVQNCVWMAMVLIAWNSIFFRDADSATHGRIMPYVTKIWVCLLLGTILWLLKTIVVKALASSFHVSTFFERIQEALFNQYVIETLSAPPMLSAAGSTKRLIGTEEDKKNNKGGITIDHVHRFNQKNVSAWNMKRLMSVLKRGIVSTLDEKIHGGHDVVGNDEKDPELHIVSENHAKAAAKKIFNNVAQHRSRYIYEEDLLRFMREDEVLKTMRRFEDGSEEMRISKKELKNWVVDVFRERRALGLSLNDTKTAINKLHRLLNVAVGVVIIIISLLVLEVATTQFFVVLSSQLLLVAFVFGNTCKAIFEAMIFLFVMHPFDVGDRVEVDGVNLIVEEMNILTTVFLKSDNLKLYYPNFVLSTKPIHNYYRSPDMGEAVEFCIHVSTPVDKIGLMKKRIIRYIENKPEHWQPDPSIVLKDVEDMNRIKISVWPNHRMNFQNMRERWVRRELLLEEMVKTFRELDIEYRSLPLDVNVRNMSSPRMPSNWRVCAP